MVQLRTNRRGRLALLSPRCPTTLLLAYGADGYAAQAWDRVEDQTELVLGGVLELSGVVRDAQGHPVDGATVSLDSAFWRTHGVRRTALPSFAYTLHLPHHFRSETDGTGRFSLWVPEGADSVPLSVSPPGTKPSTQEQIELNERSRSDVEIVIR